MADAVYFDIQPTKASLDNLNRMVRRLFAETGRSVVDALGYAGVKVCTSGAKAAKLGKKKRRIIPNPAYKEASKALRWAARMQKQGKAISQSAQAALDEIKTSDTWAPYHVERLTQGKPIMWPTWNKQDPRAVIDQFTPGKIGGRGLAKKTWEVMGAHLASMKGAERFTAAGSGYRIKAYKERYGETRGANVMRLVNSLSYMDKAYPGIGALAVEKGARALEHELDKRMAQATRKANAA